MVEWNWNGIASLFESGGSDDAQTLLLAIKDAFDGFVEQHNLNVTDKLLNFNIRYIDESEDKCPRVIIHNAYISIVFKGSKNTIKAYIIRSTNLSVLEKHETLLNMKLHLRVTMRKGQRTLLLDDGVKLESELPTILMSVFEEAIRKSHSQAHTNEPSPRVVMDGNSISTAVRELVTQRNDLLNQLLLHTERTHNEIARDIHDQVISDLLFLKKALASNLPENQPHIDVTDGVIASLRDICNGLSSRDLKSWGLLPCIKDLVANANAKSETQVSFAQEVDVLKLAPEVELHVFRIVQEAVNNALKHARANNVILKICKNERDSRPGIDFSVTDDGLGVLPVNRGTGIHIMNERAAIISTMIPAQLLIEAEPSVGTSVILKLSFAE